MLISEQGDDAFAASLAKLQTPLFASCRGNGPLTFVTLRLGTVVGLRPVVDELAREARSRRSGSLLGVIRM